MPVEAGVGVDRVWYLMGLDALDVAGEVKVELELVNVLHFVLLGAWFFVALDRLLRLLFLKCRLGDGGLDGHMTALTSDKAKEEQEEGSILLSGPQKIQSNLTEHQKCCTWASTFVQCFDVGECHGVFGDHIGQNMCHTCSDFFFR